MWTFVGESVQSPRGKPSVKISTACSEACPEVNPNELSLRHVSPDAVRYEIVSVPQKLVPLFLSLVSSNPLTVPLARWPSILKSPQIAVEPRSLFRLAVTGRTPQLDSNVPLHVPVTAGWTSPGALSGSSHAGRQHMPATMSRDRYMGVRRAKQVQYRQAAADRRSRTPATRGLVTGWRAGRRNRDCRRNSSGPIA